jgi:hypothetical protein
MLQSFGQTEQAECICRVERTFGNFGDQTDIFQRGQARNQIIELKYESHMLAAETGKLLFNGAGKFVIEIVDLADGWHIESAENVEQRRFAAPDAPSKTTNSPA